MLATIYSSTPEITDCFIYRPRTGEKCVAVKNYDVLHPLHIVRLFRLAYAYKKGRLSSTFPKKNLQNNSSLKSLESNMRLNILLNRVCLSVLAFNFNSIFGLTTITHKLFSLSSQFHSYAHFLQLYTVCRSA